MNGGFDSQAFNATSTSEYNSISSQTDAIDLIRDLVSRQLTKANELSTLPNQSAQGDDDVKTAFWLLLDDSNKRTLFLKLCKNRHFWPRVRTTIGSPPFSFLGPQDNDVLRAGGITIGRTNMSAFAGITSANEIGRGQFVDENDRRFKVVADDSIEKNHLPHMRVLTARRIVLDVKLPRMKKVDRLSVLRNSNGRGPSVTYPRCGERLSLSPNRRLGGGILVVTVRTVEAHKAGSPVARLFCSTM